MTRIEPGVYKLRNSAINKRLALMAGMKSDLAIAERCMLKCTNSTPEVLDTCLVLEEALWTTALIRYSRCFDSERSKIANEIIIHHLSPGKIDSHEFFRYIRDKTYSHPVGPGQDDGVGAYVGMVGTRPMIKSIDSSYRRISSPGLKEAHLFIDLIRKCMSLMEISYEKEKSDFLYHIKKLPLDQVIVGEAMKKKEMSWGRESTEFLTYKRGLRKKPRRI